MYSRRLVFAGVAVVSIGGGQVHAAANLLVNGDFSQETLNGSTINQSYGLGTTGYTNPSASYSGATATGWVNGGYTFVFVPGSGTSGTTADTAGAANAEFSGGNLSLWGPGNGSANGLTNSPNGGNFIAQDGAFQNGALYQAVSGLTVGYDYFLSFYWAAAQQQGFSGATTEAWNVYWTDASSFAAIGTAGTTTVSVQTQVVSNPNMGFTPWRLQTYTFQATSTTQTLAFLAQGTPNGTPPFALLDGVLLTVAEPSSWGLGLVGFVGAGLLTMRRRRAGAVGGVAWCGKSDGQPFGVGWEANANPS
jgi:hypothetical protein